MGFNQTTLIQGSSMQLSYGLQPAIDLSVGWTCNVEVIPKALGLTGTPSVTKTITALSANNKYFLGKLTPAESASLAPGDYWVVGQLENTTLQLEGEDHQVVTVTDQGIA